MEKHKISILNLKHLLCLHEQHKYRFRQNKQGTQKQQLETLVSDHDKNIDKKNSGV